MFTSLLKKLLFLVLIWTYSLAQAAIPNRDDDPTSYVGTTGKAKFARSITAASALSVLGEAGPRNLRFGGTLGWLVKENQRLKISGEFLRQDIKFAFFSGDSREWVNQAAVGGHYQYDLSQSQYLPQLNLKAGYSHAPSRQLGAVAGSYVNGAGDAVSFVDYRRIAGSNAGYFSPGLSVEPWHAGRVGVELNYDDVKYDRIYSPRERAVGFGGSANFTQQLGEHTNLGAAVGLRKPFNVYQVNLAYTLPTQPDWALGVDANYVDGKQELPNTYNVGLSVSYVMQEGQRQPNYLEKEPTTRLSSGLNAWVAEPAIYIPQVLAITDERVAQLCSAPVLVSPIPTQRTLTPVTISLGGFFSGSAPLRYTASFENTAAEGTTVTVNQATGVLTISPGVSGADYTFNVTVTASNGCGSASTTFLVDAPFDSGL